jgi:hypothetical protein
MEAGSGTDRTRNRTPASLNRAAWYTNEVPTGVPGKNGESPAIWSGVSALVKPNVSEAPGARADAGVFSTHWRAYPFSGELGKCVTVRCQPTGVTKWPGIGFVGRKSSPGIQAYQNVPMTLVLAAELVSVIVWSKLAPLGLEPISANAGVAEKASAKTMADKVMLFVQPPGCASGPWSEGRAPPTHGRGIAMDETPSRFAGAG